MTDSHLRELERRWKETGAVEDEAAYLLERVRRGELKQNMVELAAYCGHRASILAVGKPKAEEDSSFEWFARGLNRWGKKTNVRTAVAVAQRVEAIWSVRYPGDNRPQLAIQAVIDWILCSSKNHVEVDANTAVQAAQAWGAANRADPAEAAYYAAVAAAEAAEIPIACDARITNHHAWGAVRASRVAVERAMGHDAVTAEFILRTLISTALIPWALGYHDPLQTSNEEQTPPSD